MEIDHEEIYKWIDSYQFSRQKKNINRDFADAVPLAEILKQHYPKLVELHNYAPKNAFAQKLINWSILQRKVLSKLKINLTKANLEELAKAEPGAIERVLWQVKCNIEKQKEKRIDDNVYIVEGLENELTGSILPIKTKQGEKITEQKIVPAEIFDEMVKDLEEKDMQIKALNIKVEHLEKMIGLKDERIEDLETQIKSLQSKETPSNTRLINAIF